MSPPPPSFVVRALLATCLSALALPCSAAAADAAEARGLEIAEEADRRDRGFGDFVAELEMVLRDRHGQESRRVLRSSTLEQVEDGDKTLIVFDHPDDVKGTALLTWSHKDGNDDQWLYLPALKRVKRIASGSRTGPFLGSEFAYEDLSSQEVEEYLYRFVREEELDGVPCFVIARYPRDPRSGYRRQVVWLDRDHYRMRKIDFYDRKNELFKTLTFSGYRLYLDRHWRPARMEMVNHRTGKSTDLVWQRYRFATGLEERDFERTALTRLR